MLERDYDEFESLDNIEKLSFVLSSELWESKLDGLLSLLKVYIVDGLGNIKTNYMIMTQLVNNSILSLQLRRGMVSSVKMVS